MVEGYALMPWLPAQLAGKLLVASPMMADSSFYQAVIMLIEHTDEGAIGVILNRPTPVEVAEVLPVWRSYTSGPGVLFHGGPVGLDNALALACIPGTSEPLGWQRVCGGLGLVDLDAPPEVLVAEIAALRIFAGYAGWGAGQLEEEIGEGAWFVLDAHPGDAFVADTDGLWRSVLQRQRSELALLCTYTPEPVLN